MPAIVGRGRARRGDHIWPGFVDALASLLLAIIFVLAVFMVTHFFLSQALSGRDEALEHLNRQLTEIADLLALERQSNDELRLNINQLSASLQVSTSERDELMINLGDAESKLYAVQQTVAKDRETVQAQLIQIKHLKQEILALTLIRDGLEDEVGSLAHSLEASESLAATLRDRSKNLETRLSGEKKRALLSQKEIENHEQKLSELHHQYIESAGSLSKEKEISAAAQAQVILLNQQLNALRTQLTRLNAALEAAEAKDEEKRAVIADLGKRLNVALAHKVEELSQYRSEFFGRLREILGNRRDIRVVGDRFVFQSEVFFASASAEIGPSGQAQLAQLATALLEIARSIPPELPWVLRVDGHTDVVPISTARFLSNWELSTARAVSVVKFLIEKGVAANRLAATGFGEFQPLDSRADEIGHRRNRRIELKLTER